MGRKLKVWMLCCLFAVGSLFGAYADGSRAASTKGDRLKWMEFEVPYEALSAAMKLDIDSYDTAEHLDWISLLASLAAKYGGEWKRYKKADLEQAAERLKMEAPSGDSYDYYYTAYSAVLGGFLGQAQREVWDETQQKKVMTDFYGLKAFSPLAKGYGYSHFDDYGTARSFGYSRPHLGHDLMGSVGTPVIAVEAGYVETLGWNAYGGWRIGIRSFDSMRYYYYAHLRQSFPYHKELYEGKRVEAGDVIGYLGCTGYSTTENKSNIETPHLHIGLEIIFDETQKDGYNQIWVNFYDLTKLLEKNKSAVEKNSVTGDYERVYQQFETDE